MASDASCQALGLRKAITNTPLRNKNMEEAAAIILRWCKLRGRNEDKVIHESIAEGIAEMALAERQGQQLLALLTLSK